MGELAEIGSPLDTKTNHKESLELRDKKVVKKNIIFPHDKCRLHKGCPQEIANQIQEVVATFLEDMGGMSSRGGRLHCDSSNLKT